MVAHLRLARVMAWFVFRILFLRIAANSGSPFWFPSVFGPWHSRGSGEKTMWRTMCAGRSVRVVDMENLRKTAFICSRRPFAFSGWGWKMESAFGLEKKARQRERPITRFRGSTGRTSTPGIPRKPAGHCCGGVPGVPVRVATPSLTPLWSQPKYRPWARRVLSGRGATSRKLVSKILVLQ